MVLETGRITEKGSVIFWILAAIAMLAALSFALMDGSRTGASNLTEQQTRIAAQEILDYADTVAKSVQKLRLRGCSDNEISFENSTYPTDTFNPRSPTDKSCHVFDKSGGSINYKMMPSEWLANTIEPHQIPASIYRNHVGFIGSSKISGENNKAEIAMVIPWISDAVCEKIDDILGKEFSGGGAWISHHLGPYEIREPPGYISSESSGAVCEKYDGPAPFTGINTLFYVLWNR